MVGNQASTMTTDRLEAWTPRALSVLRIMTGLLFLEHGTQKLLGFPPSEHSFPALFSLMGLQGILELVGGFLILIGLFTRPVAFILAGNMAVAYFMAHAPKGFFPTLNGGQLAILFCFVFLYLAVAGGGQWSVDTQIARRRSIA
jgi:putative oxidoreductase